MVTIPVYLAVETVLAEVPRICPENPQSTNNQFRFDRLFGLRQLARIGGLRKDDEQEVKALPGFTSSGLCEELMASCAQSEAQYFGLRDSDPQVF